MSELIWHPFQPTPSDIEFMEQQRKWQKEFMEKYSITFLLVGVVSEYTDDEKQEAWEKFEQMLVDAAQKVVSKHEYTG